MRPGRQKTFSVSWLAGVGWSFGGYVTGTLLAAGAGALDFPLLAQVMLLAAAVCFAASLAVSYTHLDVYKRQERTVSPCSAAHSRASVSQSR